MSGNTFSLLPFICEAFSINQKIYKDIDLIYNKNKIKYYQSAKENEFYNHQMAREGSLKQEEYFKKVLGIILNQDDIGDKLYDLIYKGWRYTVTYVENHSKINLLSYMQSLAKKKKGLENITDNELNSNLIILLQMAENAEKEIETSDQSYIDFVNGLYLRREHYNNPEFRLSLNKAMDKDKIKVKELKNEIYMKYGKFYNLNEMFTKDENIKEYIENIFLNYDFEELSLISISNEIKIPDKMIDEILLTYINSNKEINSLDGVKYLINMIQIRVFSKVYKETKKYYFENNSDTMLIKINELDNELDIKKNESKALEDKIKKLELENSRLERENKRFELLLDEVENNKNELSSLREYIFNQNNDIEIIENKMNDYSLLNDIRALMIGGSSTTYENIKDNFNKLIHISPYNINFDKNLVENIDIILIFVNYLSHALYYKIMASSKDKKIIYINNQNKDIILTDIKNNI